MRRNKTHLLATTLSVVMVTSSLPVVTSADAISHDIHKELPIIQVLKDELSPTEDPTPTPTGDPSPSPTEDPTPTPTGDPSPSPTEDPTPTPTGDPSPSPTEDPTPTPTGDPSPSPTEDPTPTPTGDPSPSPTEDPTPTPTGIEGFVRRLYEVALGRAAEPAGLEFWCGKIEEGTSAVGAAEAFLKSEEFLNKNMPEEEFVETLYQTFFGRPADDEGKTFWVKTLNDGATKNYVMAGFANSDEFHNLCDSYGVLCGTYVLSEASDLNPKINAFVALAYKGILGRESDEAGLRYWVDRIVNEGLTASQMVEGFFNSDEILNKDLSAEEFVTLCYRTFLLREPETEGLNGWAARLTDEGLTRKFVLKGFSDSQEFANLCKEYGVTKGSITTADSRDELPTYTSMVYSSYKTIVGEAPSDSVMVDYMSKIANGAKSLRDTLEDIAALGEGNQSTEEWIAAIYKAALNRGCSDAELASQIETAADSGMDVVIESIIESGEFDDRCEKLGLYPDCMNYTERGENGAIYGYSFDGELLIGWNYVDGLKYFFYNDGTMCQDIRDIIGDQDRYYLTVNTARNIIMVYTWDDATDDWNIPVVAFVASCGRPGTETILGDYTLHSQSRWGLMMGDVYCQYLTRISGDFLIHSECYSTTNVRTMDTWGYSLLGQAASHGCVRTTCANAKWVYEHCNECPIHIYNDASVFAPFDKPVPPPCTGTFDPTDPLC